MRLFTGSIGHKAVPNVFRKGHTPQQSSSDADVKRKQCRKRQRAARRMNRSK